MAIALLSLPLAAAVDESSAALADWLDSFGAVKKEAMADLGYSAFSSSITWLLAAGRPSLFSSTWVAGIGSLFSSSLT